MRKFKHSEITPEKIYNRRRSFIKSMGYGLGALTLNSVPLINAKASNSNKLNSYEDITTYNNYYEFGTGKGDPHRRAKNFTTRPWSVKIEGEVENSLELPIEEILSIKSEERILKLRCVEGWSMVIPWLGFSLSELLNKVQIKPTAKFVEFETVYNPEEMVGQRYPVLNWPYIEGLRIDEAMHPLTTVVTGLYGKPLPNQNGKAVVEQLTKAMGGTMHSMDIVRGSYDFVVVAEMPSFDDFAAIKLVVEGSGAVKNLTMLEAIDFTKATSKASKIGYKAPGQ